MVGDLHGNFRRILLGCWWRASVDSAYDLATGIVSHYACADKSFFCSDASPEGLACLLVQAQMNPQIH